MDRDEVRSGPVEDELRSDETRRDREEGIEIEVAIDPISREGKKLRISIYSSSTRKRTRKRTSQAGGTKEIM